MFPTFKEFLIEKKLGIVYHGTSSEIAAQQILKDNILKPNLKSNGGNFQPMDNHAYFTTNLSYALIYGLGAAMVGIEMPTSMMSGGKYGYIFVGDNSSIKNHVADEDQIGEIARNIVDDEDYYNFTEDEIEHVINLVRSSFDSYIEEDYEDELEQSPYERFIDYEEELYAYVGKYILQHANKRILIRFRQNADQYSNNGEVKISAAYRFNKSDSINFKKDGSNFFEYATKIR